MNKICSQAVVGSQLFTQELKVGCNKTTPKNIFFLSNISHATSHYQTLKLSTCVFCDDVYKRLWNEATTQGTRKRMMMKEMMTIICLY